MESLGAYGPGYRLANHIKLAGPLLQKARGRTEEDALAWESEGKETTGFVFSSDGRDEEESSPHQCHSLNTARAALCGGEKHIRYSFVVL